MFLITDTPTQGARPHQVLTSLCLSLSLCLCLTLCLCLSLYSSLPMSLSLFRHLGFISFPISFALLVHNILVEVDEHGLTCQLQTGKTRRLSLHVIRTGPCPGGNTDWLNRGATEKRNARWQNKTLKNNSTQPTRTKHKTRRCSERTCQTHGTPLG